MRPTRCERRSSRPGPRTLTMRALGPTGGGSRPTRGRGRSMSTSCRACGRGTGGPERARSGWTSTGHLAGRPASRRQSRPLPREVIWRWNPSRCPSVFTPKKSRPGRERPTTWLDFAGSWPFQDSSARITSTAARCAPAGRAPSTGKTASSPAPGGLALLADRDRRAWARSGRHGHRRRQRA